MKNSLIREVTAKYIGTRRKSSKISDSSDAAPFLRKLVKDEEKEHFIALYLDSGHCIKTYSVVSIGTLNACQVHSREVFRPAILVAAASVIVAHNLCDAPHKLCYV